MEDKDMCCPKMNPEKWDEKSHTWEGKLFIKASMPTLFHMPLPSMINKKMTMLDTLVREQDKYVQPREDTLLLFHDPSAFRSEIFYEVSGEVENAENVTISGEFFSKVFDGEYNAVPKFMKEMDQFVVSQGRTVKDYYIHYAYCPECAKKEGHNYMIFFAQV